jgi:xanthine dehydrogenase molybdenum-binding subunit
MSERLSYVGKRLARPDIAAKVTGKAVYTADVALPGLLQGRILGSPHPHAKIAKIDTTRARALPGVVAVITHADVPSDKFTRSTLAEAMPDFAFAGERLDQTILTSRARHVGDWVAAVAAEDIYIAEQALALIEVDYEPLPAVFDPRAALRPDAPLVHDDAPGNVAQRMEFPFNTGDTAQALAEADAVVEFTGVSSRQKHIHLETDAAVAWFDADGRLTVISPSQGPHLAKRQVARRIFRDIDEGKIHWISPAIGGGFGARLALGVEPAAIALARAAGRPVRVTTTREEDFSGYSSRTDHHQTVRLGAKRDGTLTAIDYRIVADSGAYFSHSGSTTAVNVQMTLGTFQVPNRYGQFTIAYTNTPTTSGFRGYGNAEGAFVLQQAIDILAEKLDIDPVEIRLKNIQKAGDPSCLPPVPVEHTRLDECLRRGAERFGWTEKWGGWGRRRTGRCRRGVGVSAITHSSGAGGFLLETSNASIKLAADGSASLFVSPCEMGQGILGALTQVAAESSGLPREAIHVVTGDTDITPFDLGSHASRSMLVVGNAVADAGAKIKHQIRERSVPLFALRQVKAEPSEIEVREGRVFLVDRPDVGFDLREVAEASIFNFADRGDQIAATGAYSAHSHHPNHQAAFAEVEVDTHTGVVKVIKYLAAHDIGRAINPQLVEGQIEGGAIQGLGFALTEDFVIDPDTGVVLSNSLQTYRVPTANDIPEIEIILVEDPYAGGPFGAKGVGESGIVNPAAVIANAIYDAIGVRMTSLPMAADKILYLLQERQKKSGVAPGASAVSGQSI